MSSVNRSLARALDRYLTADAGDDVAQAWQTLGDSVKTVEDVKVVAEAARAAHKALVEEVQRRKELVQAIEAHPNPILPVVAGVEPYGFVVSQGRGAYVLVGAMPDAETGAPVLTQDELAARGPCMGALSPDGSMIVQALWPDDHMDLALLIFGHDTGIVDSLDDEFGDGGTPLPVHVPVVDERVE